MPALNGNSLSRKPPVRTRLFVWVSVLAMVGLMTLAGGAALAWLLIEGLPTDP
jgi:hypothetical protein